MAATARLVELQGLLQRLGYDAFRPGQERVICSLLAGRDALAVLPTGAGKSLVYQVAAQALPGVTLVVSPLIALMKDQVESIRERGLAAAILNSTLSESEAAEQLADVTAGATKLLFVTPERCASPAFLRALRALDVSLFVVDEAHCISEWGHDFRPSYLALGDAIAMLGKPVTLALTATATPWIRNDIIERLNMRCPDVVVRDIDRPNLFLEVFRIDAEQDAHRLLRELLTGAGGRDYPPKLAEQLAEAAQGSGIIYTATTNGARQTAEWLRAWGIAADYYHGRRRKADRERVQEGFMRGDLRVICATNAFGLGIDKPDVRFVIHRDIPGSVEAYYQEAGRAGRDGAFARCAIIYRPADLGRAAFLAGGGQIERADVECVQTILTAAGSATERELLTCDGLTKLKLQRLLGLLAEQGVISVKRHRATLLRPFDPDEISLEDEERRRAYERSRLEMARAYAELDGCRRRFILNYFGEQHEAERCGMCDVDVLRAETAEERAQIPSPFEQGDQVVHESWGPGVVQRIVDDNLTVLFDAAGYKTLALAVVQERGLLRPA